MSTRTQEIQAALRAQQSELQAQAASVAEELKRINSAILALEGASVAEEEPMVIVNTSTREVVGLASGSKEAAKRIAELTPRTPKRRQQKRARG